MTPGMRRAGEFAVFAAALVMPSFLYAGIFVFARGGRVQLPARHEAKEWRLDTPTGPRAFVDADFSRVVNQPEPSEEWPDRLKKARSGDINARFAAAWWAFENGLTTEAIAEFKAIHADSATHEPTASLCKTLDRIAPACTAPDLSDIQNALKGNFQQAKSSHFLIFYQGPEVEARERLELLEKVYQSFYLMFAAMGFSLEPPQHALVGAMFTSDSDYRDFLVRNNARPFLNTQGYYHPTLNLVATYRTNGLKSPKTSLAAIDARRLELAAIKGQVDRMPANARVKIEAEGHPPQTSTRAAAKTWLAWAERDLARQELLVDLDRRSIDLAIAAHETIHSLASNSKLALGHVPFPIWLHEGLACQFEVIRGGRWAGISRVHDIRIVDWRTNLPAPRVAEVIRDEGFGRGYNARTYASAWALVYYLRKSHPKEFAAYLDKLRAPSRPNSKASSSAVATFQSCFGDDLRALEVDWHRYMRELKTPIEEGLATKP